MQAQNSMYYVYILQSQKDKTYYYGFTEDLKRRITEHNSGKVEYTKKHNPYVLVWYCSFTEKEKALAFEKYLKSSSGFSFSRKRLI